MKIFKKISLTLMLTITLLSSLTACNTIAGMGKDLEKGGKSLQNSAK